MATACNDDGAHRGVARDLGRARPDNELTTPPDPLPGLPALTLYPLADPLDTNQPVRTAFLPAISAHLHGVSTRTLEVTHEQFIGTTDFASRHCGPDGSLRTYLDSPRENYEQSRPGEGTRMLSQFSRGKPDRRPLPPATTRGR